MILGYNMQGNLNQIFTLKLISSFSGLLWSFFFSGLGRGVLWGGGGEVGTNEALLKEARGHKKAEVVILFNIVYISREENNTVMFIPCISISDMPIWSKLQSGRLPNPNELHQIIENQLKFSPAH